MPMQPSSLRNPLVSRTFSALRHRNYRLYISGQVFSLIGTWMQIVAVGWLVLRITNSPLLLGLVTLVCRGALGDGNLAQFLVLDQIGLGGVEILPQKLGQGEVQFVPRPGQEAGRRVFAESGVQIGHRLPELPLVQV